MAVAADTGTGVNRVETGAARRTPQHRAAQLCAGQRAQATGTLVTVGVDSPAVPPADVAAHPAGQRREARDPEAPDLTFRQVGEAPERLPPPPAVAFFVVLSSAPLVAVQLGQQ